EAADGGAALSAVNACAPVDQMQMAHRSLLLVGRPGHPTWPSASACAACFNSEGMVRANIWPGGVYPRCNVCAPDA
ncbi:hypothetical protein ACUOGS_24145, partial [Escherichia coli]